jgi:hypothetical protein
MKNVNLKPETITRLQKEYVENRKATRQDLYNRLIVAAFKNRHNPTGQDYLASAKRIRAQGI